VPAVYRNRTWNDVKSNFRNILQFYASDKKIPTGIKKEWYWQCLLRGGPGNGKTTAAWLTAVEFTTHWNTNRGKWLFFEKFEDMLGTFSAAEGGDEGSIERISLWSNAHLLIIDDFGSRDPNTAARLGGLMNLINKRWEKMRRTLITTNVSIEWLNNNIGEQVIDRITSGLILEFTGASFRDNLVIK
jgi:DNA replication protein DnaC